MNFDPKSDEIRALFPVLIQSEKAVTLLGGSHIDKADLVAARALAPLVVAADGGAHSALDHGVIPEAVIGDLDSFDPSIAPSIPPDRIHHIPEQDSTDFDKALRSISAPFVLALGFVGGRIDHELAAYHTLISRPTPPCVVLGSEDLVVHIPHRIDMDLPLGTRVSLFTMAPVTARLSGLKWSFDAIELSPTTRIGTSNAASGGPVSLSFDGSGTLLILPRDQLPTLLDALI